MWDIDKYMGDTRWAAPWNSIKPVRFGTINRAKITSTTFETFKKHYQIELT